MTKFFKIFKKPCFWSIFPILRPKIFFPGNPALSHTTSYRFLAPCQNLEKNNDTISRKRPDRQKDERDDRPYFIQPLWLPPGVQKVEKLFASNLKSDILEHILCVMFYINMFSV